MKKTVTFILAAMMLISCMAFGTNAEIKEKNAVGCIVYPMYVNEAPNMEPGVIDESWGAPIHLDASAKDAKQKQCGLWANKKVGDQPERWTLDPKEGTCDFYVVFDEESIYICAYFGDVMKIGGAEGWFGDNFYMMMEANQSDLRFIAEGDERFADVDTTGRYECGAGVMFDDETINWWCMPEDTRSWEDVKDGFILKFEIPWGWLGVSSTTLNKGCLYNFIITKGACSDPDALGNDGFFYWGKYHDISRADGASNWMMYVSDSPNAAASNTFIFARGNKTTEAKYEYVAPDLGTPVISDKEEPSSWAQSEVTKAIAADLVPEELQNNYTKGISRANLAKLLSKLLDKVYGQDPTTTTAKFNDTTDADVLKAANLGIINGYKNDDGSYDFKPENTLKRSEMAAIISRVGALCGKKTTGFDFKVRFTDTVNHWCRSELGWPVHVGIVKGTSDTTFSPESTLTTEQTIIMIYRTLDTLN